MGNIFIKKVNYEYWIYDEKKKIISIVRAGQLEKVIRQAEKDYLDQKKDCEELEKQAGELEGQILVVGEKIHDLVKQIAEAQAQGKSAGNLKKQLEVQKTEDGKVQEEKRKLNSKKWEKDGQLNRTEARGRKAAELQIQAERLKGISFGLERIRDTVTEKENLVIHIIRNQEEHGKIVTMLHRLPTEIRLLNEYGIFMPERYFDELCRIISDHYYEIVCHDQEHADNSIPESAVTGFLKSCIGSLQEKRDVRKGNLQYYYLPVAEIKKLLAASPYRDYRMSGMKEAFAVYGYVRSNAGRKDLTVAQVGKVIAFHPEKIEALKTQMEQEEAEGEEEDG